MARVTYTDNALANLERVFEFTAERDASGAGAAVSAIRSGLEILANHPYVGRQIEGELRELIISHGRTGYLALYRYLAATDEAQALAIRHQRELDYPV